MNRPSVPEMSHFAWRVLSQLSERPFCDGDVIDKAGRTELVDLGLAERKEDGMNQLTATGAALAARLATASRPFETGMAS